MDRWIIGRLAGRYPASLRLSNCAGNAKRKTCPETGPLVYTQATAPSWRNLTLSIVLRNYQLKGVEDIRAAFRAGRKSVCFVGPTGMGKGRILVYIAHGAVARSNRITIIVHRQELIRQTAAALREMDVHFGIIAAGHEAHPEYPVQLAMIGTLARRMEIMAHPHLLIVDECHHLVSESYRQIIARFPAAKILGLTATPQRLDGRGLGSVCDQLVLGPSVQSLIDEGFLSPVSYYAPPTDLDLAGVRRTAGDFNRTDIGERVDRPTITGSAVEHYAKLCPGKSAVVFCASVKHAEHVRDQFNAAGFPAASIDGTLDDDLRIDRVAALASGRIKILTSVDIISEGFDLPSVEVAILLRPTESLALHLQQVGRVLRPAPGKVATVIDHVGNCLRHGLAEEPREWSLAGRAKRSSANKPFQLPLSTCPDCFCVHDAAPACPQCGHKYPEYERRVREVEGQLERLTAEKMAAERAKIAARVAVGRAKTKEELTAIAEARGYKQSWVRMMMRIRGKKIMDAKYGKPDAPQTEMAL